MSVSLSNNPFEAITTNCVSSNVVFVSFKTTGTSFTAVTVIPIDATLDVKGVVGSLSFTV